MQSRLPSVSFLCIVCGVGAYLSSGSAESGLPMYAQPRDDHPDYLLKLTYDDDTYMNEDNIPAAEGRRRDEIVKLRYYATVLLNGQVRLGLVLQRGIMLRTRASSPSSFRLGDRLLLRQ